MGVDRVLLPSRLSRNYLATGVRVWARARPDAHGNVVLLESRKCVSGTRH